MARSVCRRDGPDDPDRPTVPAVAFGDRLDGRHRDAERGFEAVLVGVGPDLEYLTGYRAMPLERLTLLVVARAAQPFLVVPRLERAAAQAGTRVDVPIRTWEETEDPYAVALSGLAPSPGREVRFAVSDRLWASHLLAFQARLAADDRFDAYAFGLGPRSGSCGRSRIRTRSRCCGWPRMPPIASLRQLPPAGSSGGPRPTSRTRSASG